MPGTDAASIPPRDCQPRLSDYAAQWATEPLSGKIRRTELRGWLLDGRLPAGGITAGA